MGLWSGVERARRRRSGMREGSHSYRRARNPSIRAQVHHILIAKQQTMLGQVELSQNVAGVRVDASVIQNEVGRVLVYHLGQVVRQRRAVLLVSCSFRQAYIQVAVVVAQAHDRKA